MAIDHLFGNSTQFGPNDIRRYARRYIIVATLVAVALHFVGIGLIRYERWFDTPDQVAVRIFPYEKLPEPPELNPEQLEVIEVPERSRTPERPEQPTPLRADKNAIARDRSVEPLIEGLPFSIGDSEMKVPDEEGGVTQHARAASGYNLSPRSRGMDDFREAEDIPVWSPDLLLRPEYRGGQHGDVARDPGPSGIEKPRILEHSTGPPEIVHVPVNDLDERPEPTLEEQLEADLKRNPGTFGFGVGNANVFRKYNNQASVAKDFGDFSFSTIEWNYAPYLYALRARVYRNWHPPPAFFMGIVSGRVIVRFKIMRDGSVEDFEFRSYREDRAYQSLQASSKNAILGSNPFPPLPRDFPDPFLEISATFFYRIIGD